MTFRGSTHKELAPRITAWSFSRLKTWMQCPFKAKLAYLDKLPEPESQPMIDGKRVHKLAEDYLNGKLQDVPAELALFESDYQRLREVSPLVEKKFALRQDLTECAYFAKDAWFRAQFDGAVLNDDGTMWVYDLKTGSPRQDDKDQLSLFAFVAMTLYPDVNEVFTELWYSKTGSNVSADYSRKSYDALKTLWLNKAKPMLADEEFLPTPNGLCGWCHYRKSNDGPCKFG